MCKLKIEILRAWNFNGLLRLEIMFFVVCPPCKYVLQQTYRVILLYFGNKNKTEDVFEKKPSPLPNILKLGMADGHIVEVSGDGETYVL